jgi:hypothetical protein
LFLEPPAGLSSRTDTTNFSNRTCRVASGCIREKDKASDTLVLANAPKSRSRACGLLKTG